MSPRLASTLVVLGLMLAGHAASAAPPAIVLLGPPGAGKSTQARMIAERFDLPIIATGDLLRAEATRGTALGLRIADAMAHGELLGDDIVEALVAQRLRAPECADGVILDGFPRTLPQARFLDKLLAARDFAPPVVLFFELPDAVAIERLAQRGRGDDQRRVVARRLYEWRTQSAPIVGYYAHRGLHPIAADQSREAVFEQIVATLRAHVP